MKRNVFAAVMLVLHATFFSTHAAAQTNVTAKYIDNPNFEARFAGWDNVGGMTYQTNNSFKRKNGMVYMEKYVSKGSKIGSTASMKQTLVGLPVGTYTLVVGAQNIQQDNTATKQTGAFLYAGNEQVEVNDSTDYSLTFTVLTGQVEIGLKTSSCTGNWVCIDNFRLYSNDIVKDSVNLELQKLIDEAESVIGDGVTAPQLQTAIDDAKALLTSEGDYQAVAKALERATLNYRVQNATGTAPTVTTESFVPTGVTIALGRLTVKGTAKERGFCWSTEPEPTVLDNRSTRYFSNNGNIYCMEHMKPATVYYVRAYAMTSGWKVGYGDVVKIATLPKGNVTTWYDYEGDDQTDYRIASAVNEVQWLYDNLSNIRGFNLSVHYSPGSGAGGGTADCSYGGYMRVSQNTPYQQTGTILHETNHGVGVGTTNEWYNNSNLRAETTRGLWLGPRANQVVRFLENDKTANLTGDGTHMWPYGINGANEDVYNPESTILYYGNVLTTHALHQDGLICSWNVGFATPAYVFPQIDNQKYFIKCEDTESTGYLTVSVSNVKISPFDAENSDDFAWYIGYDPTTSYYTFQHVGSGKYLTLNSGSIKAAKKTSLTDNEKFHLLPARQATTAGDYSGTGFWITANKGASCLQVASSGTSTSSPSLDFSNSANKQRWLFMTESEKGTYEQAAVDIVMTKLDEALKFGENILATPHKTKTEEGDLEAVDNVLSSTLSDIAAAKTGYTTPDEVLNATNDVKSAIITFLGQVKVATSAQPFDITSLIENPGLDKNTDGWSLTATISNSCCEMYEKTFDFNQTTKQKMPAGTYELRVQAFQRPGSASDTYTDFVTNNTDKTSTQIYLKTTSQTVKNIWADAQNRSLGGSTSNVSGKYVPNNMEAASKWFAKGWYENSVMVTTTSTATMKLGIKSVKSDASYWTCFDNFRLYFYGNYTQEELTGIQTIDNEGMKNGENEKVYDLTGRRIDNSQLRKGVYIVNGKKVLIK